MSTQPWYPHYIGDYAGDTQDLTTLEHGVYRLLLDHYYAMAGAMAQALPALYVVCRALEPHEQIAVRSILERYFPIRNNKRTNKRADFELARLAQFKRVQSERGRAGARARWEKGSDAQAMPEALLAPMPEGMPDTMPDTMLGDGQPQPQPQPHTTATTTATTTTPKEEREKPKKDLVELPPWLSVDHWRSYLSMRVKIRKPATPRAQRMLIGKLEALKAQGYNPAQVMAEAELHCWQSFYAPKGITPTPQPPDQGNGDKPAWQASPATIAAMAKLLDLDPDAPLEQVQAEIERRQPKAIPS